MILKKKKKRCRGPKWEGYYPFLVSGCDLTRRSRPGGARQAGRAWVATREIPVMTRSEKPQVATWKMAS